MIEAIVFSYLLAFTIFNKDRRKKLLQKSKSNWILDILGLQIQGLVIPLLATVLLFQGLKKLFPAYHGIIELSSGLAFLLNFVVIDYLYYWNHRLMHKKRCWDLHKVHHTSTQMDVFATSRNTLWTSFFFIYLWGNAIGVFLLNDAKPFILSATLTACLDLWRHSEFLTNNLKVNNFLSQKLFLMTPKDHSWHHSNSSQQVNSNFGANLNIFDKLHKTYYSSENHPIVLGLPLSMSFVKKILFPF
ncbi:MAG: sterol desaturase family protein [Halobacteriovoraceae bacterium]|jgi:sterol desaturase/sphingolipid hydroxylase (fatty acid hydroxylase superfamily)|nr:sterol desaturase family protein [Halobacteriovoraceae bacterium]